MKTPHLDKLRGMGFSVVVKKDGFEIGLTGSSTDSSSRVGEAATYLMENRISLAWECVLSNIEEKVDAES